MSYYRGDYYRGDPGFLSFLGKGLKIAGGFIPGVGGLISSAGEAIAARESGKATTAIVKASEKGVLGRVTAGAKQVIAKHPVLTAAGAAGAIATAGVVAGRRMGRGGGGMGGGRKHRRMNPCNPRALRRAIRRAYSFEKLAMRVLRLTSPKKHKRFAGFKHAKRRKTC